MAVSASVFPIGYTNFEELISAQKVYVDKTAHLPGLVDGDKVTLLLRPHRFGKTLSMSMLATFLEMNYQNPEDRSRQERLFKGLHVFQKEQTFCQKFMGRYPVISISLKSAQGSDFRSALKSMLLMIGQLYSKYDFIRESKKLDPLKIETLKRRIAICENESFDLTKENNLSTAKTIVEDSLKFLNDLLFKEFGLPSVIIIDEYDVPLQKATVNGYYPEMLEVVKALLGNALKDNTNLFRGYVTGCLRISHQSIFTDVNNFKSFGSQDTKFSDFIGLTVQETQKLFIEYGLKNRLQDAIDWYDGYNFSGTDMLCPWSVLNFMEDALDNDPATFRPQNYWASSSGNDILEICMRHPDETDSMRLQNLMEGKPQEIALMEFTSYPDISSDSNFDVFGTLMLHTGYFTKVRDSDCKAQDSEKSKGCNSTSSGSARMLIKIPNQEVRHCFADKANKLFGRNNSQWLHQALDMREAFLAGDVQKAEELVNSMLKYFISLKDSAYESFYHGFLGGVLGMTVTDDIKILSNRESGDGYADLVVKNNRALTAAILELKKSDDDEPLTMERVCKEALKQIDDTNYDHDFKATYRIIHKYGLAFRSKKCRIAKERSSTDL
ncbi:MAG: AAA family ATPase [Succinivibrionaceae bacterium]|nr:AAA family ATPase [Succinivibrionaceae bacterium]